MIKNIIFDIGGVLTEFDPNDYLGPFNFDEQTAKAISAVIFKNQFWKDYMVGQISPTQFQSNVIKENLHFKKEIEFVLDKKNACKMLPPLKEGVEFLKEMKKQEYKIYILSNIVQDSLDYFKENFKDVVKVLDGGIYSCEVHLKKPDERIYNLILNKYNLKAEETLFLDDSEKNIEKAKTLGIISEVCQPMLKKDEFKRIKQIINEKNREK